MTNTIINGDCLEILRTLPADSVDAIVTDPPYGISFMGKHWDYDVPKVEVWAECLRVLKPGGHILCACGTRTQHRMAVNIEDAGFEIRDLVAWIYGSGFPKSLDVGKAIDKAAGAEREVVGRKTGRGASPVGDIRGGRMHAGGAIPGSFDASAITAPATAAAKQWEGWGTALKPAMELWTLARKPLIGTVAENVLQYGTGGINVDGGRVNFTNEADRKESTEKNQHEKFGTKPMTGNNAYGDWSMIKPKNFNPPGRFPANVIHDGSEEVVEGFPNVKGNFATRGESRPGQIFGYGNSRGDKPRGFGDSGSAARFFYCAKASKAERDEGLDGVPKSEPTNFADTKRGWAEFYPDGTERPRTPRANNHPTVKPLSLMQYLCRLITPPNGIVLDPFAGSGSTLIAAKLEDFNYIGIEREPEYCEIAKARIEAHHANKCLPFDEPRCSPKVMA